MNHPFFDLLAAATGRWQGPNRLHDPHTNRVEESPGTCSVTSLLCGRFVRMDYTWAYQGAPQAGFIILGAGPDAHAIEAQWADTWHMDRQMMTCRGTVEDGQRLVLSGTYAAPPSPDWGWRIELQLVGVDALEMRMFNVTPGGESAPAAAADYTRTRKAHDDDAVVPTGTGLSEIGQIALTFRDVDRAVVFYRDALGLRFLFRPGPTLAFLSAGSVRLMLTQPQGAGTPGANSVLYFRVENVETVHAAIVGRGAVNERAPQLAAKMPDHELWIGFVRDPEGNLIGLMEEKRGTA